MLFVFAAVSSAAGAQPVMLGNRCITEDANRYVSINSPSKRLSYRFTAPLDMNVSSLWLYSGEKSGSASYEIGIQTDSNGVPSGTYLNGSTVTSLNGNDWTQVNTTLVTLTKGQIYHILITSSNASESSYNNLAYSFPNHKLFPKNQEYDGNAQVLEYNGIWQPANFGEGGMPVFLTDESGTAEFGNPYAYPSYYSIHSSGTNGATTDDSVAGEEIIWTDASVQITGVEFYVRRYGNPAEPLKYRIINVTDSVVMAEDVLANSFNVSASYSWKRALFTPVTFETGKAYRIYLFADGPSSSLNEYEVLTNSCYPRTETIFLSQTFGGTQNNFIIDSNGGASFTVYNDTDLVYGLVQGNAGCVQGVFGKTTKGFSAPWSSDGASLNSTKYKMGVTGTVNTINLNVTGMSVNSGIRVALYSNNTSLNGGLGGPQNLLTESSLYSAVLGWNTIPVPPVNITPGEYWLAFQAEAGVQIDNNYTIGSVSEGYRTGYTFSNFPAVFGATNYDDTQWSIYAQYCEVAAASTPNAGADWILATGNAQFTGRSAGLLLPYNGKMYLIAGTDGVAKNDVWSSPDGINWTQETNAAFAIERAYHTGVVFDNKMWVISGVSGPAENDVWYSTNGSVWTKAIDDAAFSPRSSSKAVVFNGKMWIIAGRDSDNNYLNDVWSSSNGVDWTLATGSAQFAPRWQHEAVAYNGKMYVIGGSDGTNKNDVWSSSDGITWTEETPAAGFDTRRGLHALPFDDGTGMKMWVIAGLGDYFYNDVWSSTNGSAWTQKTAAASFLPRLMSGACVFNDSMWIVSGNTGTYPNDVWYSGPIVQPTATNTPVYTAEFTVTETYTVIPVESVTVTPVTGTGCGINYYLYDTSTSGIGPKDLKEGVMPGGAGYTLTVNSSAPGIYPFGGGWISEPMGVSFTPAGSWKFELYGYESAISNCSYFGVTVYAYSNTLPGSVLFSTVCPVPVSSSLQPYSWEINQPNFEFPVGSRIYAQVYMKKECSVVSTAYLQYGGTSAMAHINVPASCGFSASGLWHQVDDSAVPAPRPFSSDSEMSFYYGQDGTLNYDTGAANSGSIITNAFHVNNSSDVLRYWSWEETENGSAPAPHALDKQKVYASTSGAAGPWSLLYEEGGITNSWHMVILPLSVYAGMDIWFKFEFDTVDANANYFRGWYIDNIFVGNPPPEQVFYSAGADTGNFVTGIPVVSSSGYIFVFSEAQTDPRMGVGDEVELYDGTKLYIRRKISQSQWEMTRPDGSEPAPVVSMEVTGIRRAFPSIADALMNAGNPQHLGTINLSAINKMLHIACYKDAVFTDMVYVTGYITDKERSIRIFAPYDTATEANSRQRHYGIAGSGVVIDTPNLTHSVVLDQPGSIIDGLEVRGWEGENYMGLRIMADNCVVHGCILQNTGSVYNEQDAVRIEASGINAFIVNNFIYNIPRSAMLVESTMQNCKIVFENNTVYNANLKAPDANFPAVGFRTDASSNAGSIIDACNNYVHAVSYKCFSEGGGAGFITGNGYNASSDITAPGTNSYTYIMPGSNFMNLSAGSENLHLNSTAFLKDNGFDNSVNFNGDIDMGTRTVPWDIGADEYGAGEIQPPTPTFTPTLTLTETASATGTASATATQTSTSTATATATMTTTQTASQTATETATGTPTETVTESTTQTATETITDTATQTATPSNTATQTATQSTTQTATETATQTTTESITGTVTETVTQTATGTVTQTVTQTETGTITETATNTPPDTYTITPTITVTSTGTATSTASCTATKTATETVTETFTNTASQTVTQSSTPTVSLTVTGTVTQTASPSATQTQTETATATVTLTNSTTETDTKTATQTYTQTSTQTVTETSTETTTKTSTPTRTSTGTITQTATPSATHTITATVTATNTPSVTQTNTQTNTPTSTSTDTATDTNTPTPSETFTDTVTFTYTETSTDTYTFTETPTDTYTSTPTDTFTATNTFTHTYTPTITPTFTNSPTPNIDTALDRNYAEPLKGDKVKVSIKSAAAGELIEVKVYNLSGERVRQFSFYSTGAGWNEGFWDCRNDAGKTVGQGLYFIRIKQNNSVQTKRVFIVK